MEGAKVLEEKVGKWKPEIVCCVGKGVWEGVWRLKKGKTFEKGEFEYGWQSERLGVGIDWEGARVFVAASTSGQAASLRPSEKQDIWRPLGDWTKQRRLEIAEQPKMTLSG